MKIRFLGLALVAVAAATICPAAASSHSMITGQWTVRRDSGSPGKVRVDLSSDSADGEHDHSHSSLDVDLAQVGLAAADLDSAGKHVTFTFSREAGSFACDGWAANGHASGNFTFTPSDAFQNGLRARGYSGIDAQQQFTAATLDITLGYIDGIAAAGFAHVPFHSLVAFRALGVTGPSISALRSAFGGGEMTAEQVTSMAALRVTPAFVSDMRSLGVADLTPRRAVELKALGVDRAYVDGMAKAGYPKLTTNELVQMKALGIDQTYVRHLADHGFHNLTVSQLVRMKAVGI
jgi:hypothetical protein